MPHPSIFINYRRALSSKEARMLYIILNSRYSNEVFLDKKTVEPGDIWRPETENCVRNAKVLLVLIPVDWVSYTGELVTESKLKYAENDYVREEIKTALENNVGGTDRPGCQKNE